MAAEPQATLRCWSLPRSTRAPWHRAPPPSGHCLARTPHCYACCIAASAAAAFASARHPAVSLLTLEYPLPTSTCVSLPQPTPPPRLITLPTTGVFERPWRDGFIFFCRHDSFRETFDRRVFGLTRHKMDLLNAIEPGATALFLFDQTFRYMHGVFDATCTPGFDLDAAYLRRGAHANFKGVARIEAGSPFPAQVRFTRLHDFPPLEERKFCHLVAYNDGTNVFRHRLGQAETLQLLDLLAHPDKAPTDNQLP